MRVEEEDEEIVEVREEGAWLEDVGRVEEGGRERGAGLEEEEEEEEEDLGMEVDEVVVVLGVVFGGPLAACVVGFLGGYIQI